MNARDGKPAEAPAPNRAAAAVADQSTPAVPAPKRPRASRKRKTALLGVTTLVVLAGIAYGVYYALVLDYRTGIMLVSERPGVLEGFACGFVDPAEFYQLMWRSNLCSMR